MLDRAFVRHIFSGLIIATFAWQAFPAEGMTCSDLFAAPEPLLTVLHVGARVENLPVGVATANQMKAFEPEMMKSADAVAKELKYVPGANRVRTVLYPAAGFDAATAFRVFERAETVIGTDNHPFFMANGQAFSVSADHRGWVHYSDIDRLQSVSEGIARSIMTLGPNVRILKFQALLVEGRTGHYPTSHGIVEFDMGPRTLRRRYIHIHTGKDSRRDDPAHWIASVLDAGYDAILVKGAMKTFRPYEEKLGGLFVERLRQRHGILVDGDGDLSLWPWKDDPRKLREMRVHLTKTGIEGLGYQEVHIFHFGD